MAIKIRRGKRTHSLEEAYDEWLRHESLNIMLYFIILCYIILCVEMLEVALVFFP